MSGPPYLEDGYWTMGGTQSPLTNSLTDSLLLDADPSLFYMCQYYKGVILLDLQPRWNACITAAGLSELDGYAMNEVLPYDPFRTKLSPQNAWRFPLLAVYPTGTDYQFRTIAWYEVMRDFELIFCLPPLNSEQWEYLHPFLQYVEKIIVDRTLQSYDSNFNGGNIPWKQAGMEKISIVGKSKYGNIALGTNEMFPTLTMKIMVTERRMPDTRGMEILDGFDNTITNSGDQ